MVSAGIRPDRYAEIDTFPIIQMSMNKGDDKPDRLRGGP